MSAILSAADGVEISVQPVITATMPVSVSRDERGIVVSMDGVFFEFGKWKLTEEHKSVLAKTVDILVKHGDLNVMIEGHTDNIGSDKRNERLSRRRAESVKFFLVERGVSASRLTVTGYGFHRPIADNDTEEGRAKNRRVELIVEEKEETPTLTEELEQAAAAAIVTDDGVDGMERPLRDDDHQAPVLTDGRAQIDTTINLSSDDADTTNLILPSTPPPAPREQPHTGTDALVENQTTDNNVKKSWMTEIVLAAFLVFIAVITGIEIASD